MKFNSHEYASFFGYSPNSHYFNKLGTQFLVYILSQPVKYPYSVISYCLYFAEQNVGFSQLLLKIWNNLKESLKTPNTLNSLVDSFLERKQITAVILQNGEDYYFMVQFVFVKAFFQVDSIPKLRLFFEIFYAPPEFLTYKEAFSLIDPYLLEDLEIGSKSEQSPDRFSWKHHVHKTCFPTRGCQSIKPDMRFNILTFFNLLFEEKIMLCDYRPNIFINDLVESSFRVSHSETVCLVQSSKDYRTWGECESYHLSNPFLEEILILFNLKKLKVKIQEETFLPWIVWADHLREQQATFFYTNCIETLENIPVMTMSSYLNNEENFTKHCEVFKTDILSITNIRSLEDFCYRHLTADFYADSIFLDDEF